MAFFGVKTEGRSPIFFCFQLIALSLRILTRTGVYYLNSLASRHHIYNE